MWAGKERKTHAFKEYIVNTFGFTEKQRPRFSGTDNCPKEGHC